jgi:hypothetical protein
MIALTRNRPLLLGLAVTAALIATLAGMVAWTRPARDSVRVYTKLLAAANRQDIAAARRHCSSRYLKSHTLRLASHGGIVGLPRNIHRNFQVWRSGQNVWLCPTNRVGPVYQFVFEANGWRFDGPIGLLQPRGRVIRLREAEIDVESEPRDDPD